MTNLHIFELFFVLIAAGLAKDLIAAALRWVWSGGWRKGYSNTWASHVFDFLMLCYFGKMVWNGVVAAETLDIWGLVLFGFAIIMFVVVSLVIALRLHASFRVWRQSSARSVDNTGRQ